MTTPVKTIERTFLSGRRPYNRPRPEADSAFARWFETTSINGNGHRIEADINPDLARTSMEDLILLHKNYAPPYPAATQIPYHDEEVYDEPRQYRFHFGETVPPEPGQYVRRES